MFLYKAKATEQKEIVDRSRILQNLKKVKIAVSIRRQSNIAVVEFLAFFC